MIIDHPVWKLDTRFHQIPRCRQLIARIIGLDDKEYRLWDLLCTLTMYKPQHPELSSIARATDLQISQILGKGWSMPTVCRTRKRLEVHMVIETIETSTYRVLVPMMKEVPSVLEVDIVRMQEEVSNLQAAPEEKVRSSNISNKSNNMSKPMSATSKPRTMVEYEAILLEGGFPGMDASDLRFIDNQNLVESRPVV